MDAISATLTAGEWRQVVSWMGRVESGLGVRPLAVAGGVVGEAGRADDGNGVAARRLPGPRPRCGRTHRC